MLQLTLAVLAVLGCASLTPNSAAAEGSAELDARDGASNDAHDQPLRDDTVFYVDIPSGSTEKICWRGVGTLAVYRPDGTTLVANVTNGNCTNAPAGVFGAYVLDTTSQQTVGTEWDVRVCASSVSNSNCLNVAGNERLGRLWSYNWHFRTGDYVEDRANNGSVFAIVPGGDVGRDAVIEMRMDDVSGFDYRLFANSIGPETTGDVRVGRSVPTAGHKVTPEFPLYLNPPALAAYNWITPNITNVQLAPSCGTSVVLDTADGEISFGSNVTGQYVVICDVNQDAVYDFASATDFSSFGAAAIGVNTVTWDGKNNSGANATPGDYNCVIRLNVGEFHYMAEDIETSYPGFRMYRMESDKTTRTAIRMFWDDRSITADGENMPNGQASPVSPVAVGLDPGSSATAASAFHFVGGNPASPTGNARAWGNFDADGKGNDAFLDTFAAADSVLSTPFVISVIAAAGDADGDALSNARECGIGSDPQDADTDGDGVDDGFEASESTLPNNDGPGDAIPDVLDTDDDGDGILTADELGGENGDGDPTDADDSDGSDGPDYLDTDSDDDGVGDPTDGARTDPNACRDLDGDSCDDCAVTGADGSGGSITSDGLDSDADGDCNDGDDDDDDDGVLDVDDDDPVDDSVCEDADGDGCDDCDAGLGPMPGNDGLDTDGDGLCDAGDVAGPDSDGDGIEDADDLDADDDGIPNTPDGTTDRDGDGIANWLDLDSDGDGLPDVLEAGGAALDDDGDGRIDEVEDDDADGLHDPLQESDGALPRPDTDDDGIRDFLDLDSDGDGISDAIESDSGDLDEDGDGLIDETADEDGNGLADVVDPSADDGVGVVPPDTDDDGDLDFQDVDADDDSVPDAIEGHDDDGDGEADTEPSGDDDHDGLDDAYLGGASLPDHDDDDLPDYRDPDDDGDGLDTEDEVMDAEEHGDDPDGDGKPSFLDVDSDDDGVDDADEAEVDEDDDGTPDYLEPPGEDPPGMEPPGMEPPTMEPPGMEPPTMEPPDDDLDTDGDGVADVLEREDGDRDTDGDGTPDHLDPDDDGDGIATRDERPEGGDHDSDDDGIPDHLDADDDDDGIPTRDEREDGAALGRHGGDVDRDGVPNHLDLDSDGDGLDDELEAMQDADDDGVPDYLEEAKISFAGGALCAVSSPGRSPSHAFGLGLLAAVAALCLRSTRRSRIGR